MFHRARRLVSERVSRLCVMLLGQVEFRSHLRGGLWGSVLVAGEGLPAGEGRRFPKKGEFWKVDFTFYCVKSLGLSVLIWLVLCVIEAVEVQRLVSTCSAPAAWTPDCSRWLLHWPCEWLSREIWCFHSWWAGRHLVRHYPLLTLSCQFACVGLRNIHFHILWHIIIIIVISGVSVMFRHQNHLARFRKTSCFVIR